MDIRIRYARTIQANEFEPVVLEMEAVTTEGEKDTTLAMLIAQVDSTLEEHVEYIRHKAETKPEIGVTYLEED